ncbi:aspartyl aminopeptidase [Thecamonas trahens ATCC 50062]|uniref:aspartyl aminopeptidase n=1 Tax=Thecamonas trahens ATCC 50062 TaxID=461836 RepID=A0A0L0DGY4_THETB|nr:aspartyl aminopeptidase [Thecamonas trahens ATCC 50062]KNC51599.1 aspartyl aminopeptidase [Thecamonas trahens ATCC 50062]|eukprot:XP_013755997.1 aspartyl aminopeptidase [Thecamonas trahens ATCC 50062]
MSSSSPTLATASAAVDFINASPSAFHAVATTRETLLGAGFVELAEGEVWTLETGGKYFVTRNQSAVMAFAVGGGYTPGAGFTMLGAHTDSPCLKVKPISHKASEGLLTVGVEVYGGPILHSWFDRDLGLAGRVVVRKADGSLGSHLVRVHRPLLRVPTLAIHLDRKVNSGFSFNAETELLPVLGSAFQLAFATDDAPAGAAATSDTEFEVSLGHSTVLLDVLLEALAAEDGCAGLARDAIVDFDLVMYDVQDGTLGGAQNEFIFASQLDNLMMSFCGLRGLLGSLDSLADDTNVRLVALFDNEEVGSQSEHGANSNLLQRLVERIIHGLAEAAAAAGSPDVQLSSLYDRTIRKSFFVSADMAHAAHPNYRSKHPDTSRPAMNKGPVIKYNARERYATTGVSAAILKEVAARADVPLQAFACRNDIPCGSTIGPMTSAHLGVRTVDMGNPQLSMHSAREMCGSRDPALAIALFEAYFTHFAAIDATLHESFPAAAASS